MTIEEEVRRNLECVKQCMIVLTSAGWQEAAKVLAEHYNLPQVKIAGRKQGGQG